ncbi:MAG TPA: trehalase family glycosidase [Thermomicrobiales bacterium]|nr:trehalase family glycosidase [Thermomicrobiales bacterium]
MEHNASGEQQAPPETDNEIREAVRSMLKSNTHEGYSQRFGTSFCYIQPSPGTYPYQYFWDTCLHVFILTALDEHELAMRNMRSLFAMQDEDGYVGHMLYWGRVRPAKWTDIFQSRPTRHIFQQHMSALIQPPLVAQTVQRIHMGTQDDAFLGEMLPKLKRYFDWLANHRDLDDDGLLSIITTFESGMDWKPTFDQVVGFPHGVANRRLFWRVVATDARNFLNRYNIETLKRKRYFLVKEVAFNTIYAQNLRALAQLCEALDDPDAQRYHSMAERVAASMIEHMYDEEEAAFYDIDGRDGSKIRVLTPTIFFPLVVRTMPDRITDTLIERHFLQESEFDTPFPIPSVALDDPSFYPHESEYLWRGPTWVFYNWFVYQCLFYRGYREEANALQTSIKRLIRQSGFREYYNPFSGAGHGAHNFTWSGLVVDMLNLTEETM